MPFLVTLIGGVVKTICMSKLSETLQQKVILILLKRIVEYTKNKVDDSILSAYEKSISA